MTVPALTPDESPDYGLGPSNIEAEQALLIALLANNRALDAIEDVLDPAHFADPAHAEIYRGIKTLVHRGGEANAVTLHNAFDHLQTPDQRSYLADLQAARVSVRDVGHYARLLRDLYLRRQLAAIAHDIGVQAANVDLDATAEQIVANIEERLSGLRIDGTDSQAVSVSEASDDYLEHLEAIRKAGSTMLGESTGIRALDLITGGLQTHRYVVVAGRPSMGKTALATNIAVNCAKAYRDSGGTRGMPAVIFSMDQERKQIVARLIAGLTGFSPDEQNPHRRTDAEYQQILDTAHYINTLPLWIDDTPGLTIAQVRSRLRRLHRVYGVSLCVIDYLQVMSASTLTQQKRNDTSEITEISKGIKAISHELPVTVLAVAQLSRAVEAREDKRPTMSDLRQSGQIEQDADLILFPYREEYYLERSMPERRPNESEDQFRERYNAHMTRLADKRGLAELLLPKNKQGRAPMRAVVGFNGERLTFYELDTDHGEDTPL